MDENAAGGAVPDDSLDVMTIVTEICDEFDVEILPTDVVPENFESVEAMWQLLMRLQED